MDTIILVATYLTPAAIVGSAFYIWSKRHINYLEKESSYFLNNFQRNLAEYEFMKSHNELYDAPAIKTKLDYIKDLLLFTEGEYGGTFKVLKKSQKHRKSKKRKGDTNATN